MSFRGYVSVFQRNWLILTITVLLCGGGLFAYSMLAPATYTAKSELFASVSSYATTTGELSSGNQFVQERVKSYAQTATSEIVLQPVIAALGLDVTPVELTKQIEVSVPLNTVILEIVVEDTSPEQAAAIANEIAKTLPNTVRVLEGRQSGNELTATFTVIQQATVPTVKTSPNTKLNIAVGLVFGLMVGMMIALIRDRFDTRVREINDLAVWFPKQKILGGVPFSKKLNNQLVVVKRGDNSELAEAFRSLRTAMGKIDRKEGPGASIVVTSSLLGEGKTTVAVNLALAFAQTGKRVAYVDANFRKEGNKTPRLRQAGQGLTDVIRGARTINEVLAPLGRSPLLVMPSGERPPNPSELLSSPRMGKIVGELADQHDLVIYDSPAIGEVTDAATLMGWADGAILVVRAGHVRRREVAVALQNLQQAESAMIGLVLNCSPNVRDLLDMRDTLEELDGFAERLKTDHPKHSQANELGGQDEDRHRDL